MSVPVMVHPDPWTRINDSYLDGTVPHEVPDQDQSHPLLQNYAYNFHEPATRSRMWPVYQKIALDIVAETVFHYPCPYVSEKTTRPILLQRMFVIAGPAGMLSLLRQQGFETWGDILDESYDQIADPCVRLRSVIKTVEDFMALDLNFVKHYLEKNVSKLRHNFENLRVLKDKENQNLLSIVEGR